MTNSSYQDQAELSSRFLADGYVIIPSEDRAALEKIQWQVARSTAEFLGLKAPANAIEFLDNIASTVALDRLNALRLHVINDLTDAQWIREAYYANARHALDAIVGNELVMQRDVSLSIQLPNDDGSLLPLHSDVWSEDSPFEVVLWIPLVDCFETKSMFVLPREHNARWLQRMHAYSQSGVEALYAEVEPMLKWLEVPFGNVLIFTHTLMHGNRVNVENTTRWSMNMRFKGLFTPYSDKRLAEYFVPLTIRPATRFGMEYRMPQGFDE